MENKNKTKEQLEKEINSLQMRDDFHLSRDKKRREEFAIAFCWNEREIPFVGDPDPITPSWEQIFIKTGKLLEIEERAKDKKEHMAMREEIKRLENKLRKGQRGANLAAEFRGLEMEQDN